ncbi:MAG: NAD(P)-binding domain-containing protein, partial [Nitrococcus sp.]|nr:NAD(P)-binding domain-containing protein [Nitrococcus sp.]
MSDSSAQNVDGAAAPQAAMKIEVAVIGGGQAGLSSAYHLRQRGLDPWRGFAVLDKAAEPGGAWQFRWPSLTLSTVNRLHDLPGIAFASTAGTGEEMVPAAVAVPRYFAAYETAFDLPVLRPVDVKVVCSRGDRLRIETNRGLFSARGLINCTGTWETPYIP